jgi:hypothetical protein
VVGFAAGSPVLAVVGEVEHRTAPFEADDDGAVGLVSEELRAEGFGYGSGNHDIN